MIISGVTDSFTAEQLRAIHDFGSDEFKIALYGDDADLGPTVTAYTTDGEITGVGYTAGGATLTNVSITSSQGLTYVDWDDPSWPTPNFIARAALIYNATRNDRSVLVLDFGANRVFSSASPSIRFPTADPDNAILRIGRRR